MTIQVAWSTGIITVPKADTSLVSIGPPEIRSYDVNEFRKELKDLEASLVGQPWTDTHRHEGEKTISGFVYARSVTLIAPYRVEFEDGQYCVVLGGGNHNVNDVRVVNQVSVVTQNSAGLLNNATGVLTPTEANQLEELWVVRGLNSLQPVVHSPTAIVAGGIAIQLVEGPPGTYTVQRT